VNRAAIASGTEEPMRNFWRVSVPDTDTDTGYDSRRSIPDEGAKMNTAAH
jgi:hypothetical protein